MNKNSVDKVFVCYIYSIFINNLLDSWKKGVSAGIKVIQIHATARKDHNEKRFLQISPEIIVTKYVAELINKEEI